MRSRFWNALDNPDFYRENMAKDALAVINGEVKTLDDAVAMTHEMPVKRDNIRFQNPRFVQISHDTYGGTAEQKDGRALRGQDHFRVHPTRRQVPARANDAHADRRRRDG
ncbi:MAG: hypothetical protein E6J42_09860 [Chloroflexi bacterium]|nr:MAG: hypothetical protein E6J42_09860 [Chloroflexota bacterium]